ncbi:unnamed protein product [Prorocentrum cordatum]|uniref:Protein xylosyltransferase n=1 Tax=Prorocentrum cordatum TaxID=2364126 RepID=A0ABN9SAD8_9DINO|nr:unnamed protein product [Polarella glacialis]
MRPVVRMAFMTATVVSLLPLALLSSQRLAGLLEQPPAAGPPAERPPRPGRAAGAAGPEAAQAGGAGSAAGRPPHQHWHERVADSVGPETVPEESATASARERLPEEGPPRSEGFAGAVGPEGAPEQGAGSRAREELLAERSAAVARVGLLATIGESGIGDVQHGESKCGLRVWSAVPVAKRYREQGPGIVLLLEPLTHWAQKNPNKWRHWVVFASGATSPVRKIRGPNHLSWHADMPEAEHAAWTEGQDDWACLRFGLRVNSSTGPEVANLTSCHRPSRLPSPQRPNNITLCYCVPPYFNPKNPGANGFYGMAQNILYHLRRGVNQVIVYLSPPNRDLALRLLAPFVSRGLCSVVFSDHEHHRTHHERNQNDCVNRLKGRTMLYRDIDFDEFLYVPQWSKDPGWHIAGASLAVELQRLVDSELHDTFQLQSEWWVKPPNTLHHLLTETKYHQESTGQVLKVISKPSRVAHDWVHRVSHCYQNSTHFRASCKPYTKGDIKVRFAHIRMSMTEAELQTSVLNGSLLYDDFFVNETAMLKDQLCAWLQEARESCDPSTWAGWVARRSFWASRRGRVMELM